MKRLKFLLLFVLSCYCESLFPEIIEIKSMKEILSHIDKETCVVFDIDNTLITSKQMLGSDRWFQKTFLRFISQGYTKEDAYSKLLPYYMEIQNATEVTLTEPIIPSLIYKLQKNCNLVIAVTSRSKELAYKTIEQLASVNIHFNKNPIRCRRLGVASHFPLSYIEGVLFAAHNNKGDLLVTLARELNCEMNKICFVDDKLIYLQQMEKACQDQRISFIGFRYGGCDETVQDFESEVAQVQLQYLGKILSNEDANKIVQAKRLVNP